jgi:hypothetical protein
MRVRNDGLGCERDLLICRAQFTEHPLDSTSAGLIDTKVNGIFLSAGVDINLFKQDNWTVLRGAQ